MRIDFFLQNIIQEQIVIVYNLFDNANYHFDNFFWSSSCKNSGDVFVAIKGNNTNGNFFIDEAIANGYKAVLSDNLFIVEEKAKLYSEIIFIVVKDVHTCLNQMASWGVDQFKGVKIAVTGSNGKTTTTYLLANLLKHFGKVLSTDKYNSQYFLKRMCFFLHTSEAHFFVAELSSDRPGYIDLYGHIIKPDYSIITSISNAHLEHFKCEEGVLLEKTALFLHTQKVGFIPDSYQQRIKNNPNLCGKLHNVCYVPEDFIIDEHRVTFYNGIVLNNPQFKGKHNYSNMNLVLHLLEKMGFENKEKIQKTLTNITCFPGRGNQITIYKANYNFVLTCEQHNSNKSSYISAIGNLEEQTIVIMGYLYEIGDATFQDIHAVLQAMENNKQVKYIFFGDDKLFSVDNLSKYRKIVAYQKDILSIIEKGIQNNIYHVLLKGSRGSKLEKYIEIILNYFSK